MEINDYVKLNIAKINEKISNFKEGTEFNDVAIKDYLQEKLSLALRDKEFENDLLLELKNESYTKSKIESIANKKILYAKHLEKFYDKKVFQNIFSKLDLNLLAQFNINEIENNEAIEKQEFKFIKSELKHLISKCLYIASQRGFTGDMQDTNYGVRVSNEGDSAQFFFIARAMLAGFNCSNVDVRTSSYDAIVDVDSKLVRVQVKGITEGNTISFFTRARGGQGNDHTHERNKPKRITGKDCDVYAAVDKQVGTCYLIPMSFADLIKDDEDAKKLKLKDVSNFLENWNVISQVAKTL